MAKHSHLPTFTVDQLDAFFSRISLSNTERELIASSGHQVSSLSSSDALRCLTVLLRRTIATLPFENLDLHYSQQKAISLNLDHLFNKMVVRDCGRGGYCMEMNAVFACVLRTLGFQVSSVGSRINNTMLSKDPSVQPKYGGWSHMVNIVTIGDTKYHADVGFGATGGPTKPLQLVSGQVERSLGTQSMRLIYTSVDQYADKDQKVWQYEFRYSDDAHWSALYSFVETEFLPEDYEVLSYQVSTSRTSWFTKTVICTKMLIDHDKCEIVGSLSLFEKEFKKRTASDSETSKTIESEKERIEILENEFGVTLTEWEKKGIKGLMSELK